MITGHPWAADLLALIAAVVFVVGAVLISSGRESRDGLALYGVGFALLAVALLIR